MTAPVPSSANRFSIENLLLPTPSVRDRSQSSSPASTTRSTPEISPASTGPISARTSAAIDPNDAFVSPASHYSSSILSHPGVRSGATPRFHQSPIAAAVADRHSEMVWAASAPMTNPWMPYGCFSLEQSLVLAQRGEFTIFCKVFYFCRAF